MSSGSLSHFLTKALQTFVLQIEQFSLLSVEVVKEIHCAFAQAANSWKSPIEFTALQWTLLKLLFILLLFTITLIGYSWKVYGKVITEKFVRPSTLKEIEELKLSVAKLKLPKEHSPRI